MNAQKLIFGAMGIFASVVILYFGIAPQLHNTNRVKEEAPTQNSLHAEVITVEKSLPATDTVPSTSPSNIESEPHVMETPPLKTDIPKVLVPQKQITTEPPPEPIEVVSPGAKMYTVSEVTTHATERSCWSAINQNVYDLTEFIAKHPGGKKNILKICGTDGTAAFEGRHGGETKPEKTLEQYLLGTLRVI